jgi:hypothetical protein
MNSFNQRLTELFEQVEPQFRADTIARYRAVAENQFKGWVTMLEGPEPPQGPWYSVGTACPDYVTWDGGMGTTWKAKVDALKAGKYRINYQKAGRDANDSVTYAKQHFIAKQTKKLVNATKLRKDRPAIEGMLVYNVLIEGTLIVKYPNGDYFVINMSMIVNHRYERGYKSFYQFPARFSQAVINETKVTARLSEKYMSENFRSVDN